MYEIEQQAQEAAIDLDNNTIEYIELSLSSYNIKQRSPS